MTKEIHATSCHTADTHQHRHLIVHVIHRLQVGGLENGLINLINNMSPQKYTHAIICMTEYTDFRNRLNSKEVQCYALHKKAGKDLRVYYRLWKLLRELKPTIVHSRNIGTIDCVFPSILAGVKFRIHGEHGRDIVDIEGKNGRYILLRKVCSPFINRFIALSKDLQSWLVHEVNIPRQKIVQIYNGVDIGKFNHTQNNAQESQQSLPKPLYKPCNKPEGGLLFGTVGRLSKEKDQLNLINAFSRLLQLVPQARDQLRLIIVGTGPQYDLLSDYIKQQNLVELVTLTGARDDVPEILSSIDIFVLPSLGEGISNTILEAMASKKPVIATKVGGNPELVEEDKTGYLVPAADPEALAQAMQKYVTDNTLISKQGQAGRRRVEEYFSMPTMVQQYERVYDELLALEKLVSA